jgi:hypothetical protein
MYLLKTNELAREFVDHNGFQLFAKLLDEECLQDYQIAYNVSCALWIISYHDFAAKGFEDVREEVRNNNIIGRMKAYFLLEVDNDY